MGAVESALEEAALETALQRSVEHLNYRRETPQVIADDV